MLTLFTKKLVVQEAPKPIAEVAVQVDPKEALWLKEIESVEQELRAYIAKQQSIDDQEAKAKESIAKIQLQHDNLQDGAAKSYLSARLVAMRGEHANINQQKQALEKALQPIQKKIDDFNQAMGAIDQDDDPTKILLQEQIVGLNKELESVKERMSDHTERKLKAKLCDVRKKLLRHRIGKFSLQETSRYLCELEGIIDEFKKNISDVSFTSSALNYLGPIATDSVQFVKLKLNDLKSQAEKTTNNSIADLERQISLVSDEMFANTSEMSEEQEVEVLVKDKLSNIFSIITYNFNIDLSSIMENFKGELLIKLAKVELSSKLDEATANMRKIDQNLLLYNLSLKNEPQMLEYLDGVQKYYKAQVKLYTDILTLDLAKYTTLSPIIAEYESILQEIHMSANSSYKSAMNLRREMNAETNESKVEILDLHIKVCDLSVSINELKMRDLYDQMVALSRGKIEAQGGGVGLLAYIPYNNNLIKVKDLLQSIFITNAVQATKKEPSVTDTLKEHLNVLRLSIYRDHIRDFICLLEKIDKLNIRLSENDFYDSGGQYNVDLLYSAHQDLAFSMSQTIITAMQLHYEYCNLPGVSSDETDFSNNLSAYSVIINEYESFHEEFFCNEDNPQYEFTANIDLLCKVQIILKSLPSPPVKNFPGAISNLIKSNLEEMVATARVNSPTSSWSSVRQRKLSIDEDGSLSGQKEPPPAPPLYLQEELKVPDIEESAAPPPPPTISLRPQLPVNLLKSLKNKG